MSQIESGKRNVPIAIELVYVSEGLVEVRAGEIGGELVVAASRVPCLTPVEEPVDMLLICHADTPWALRAC